jgi:tripeptide aminopeptidase
MSDAAVREACLSRFLKYVTYDTQSDENSQSYPSTAKQLVLLRALVEELKAIGLADAAIDEHGYVFATIPATTKKANVPSSGSSPTWIRAPRCPGWT